jgi:hypothetical protein
MNMGKQQYAALQRKGLLKFMDNNAKDNSDG